MEEIESRYVELTVPSPQAAAARGKLKPLQTREVLGRGIMIFDLASAGVNRQQLAALGDVRTPGITDLFIAIVGNQAAERKGVAV